MVPRADGLLYQVPVALCANGTEVYPAVANG